MFRPVLWGVAAVFFILSGRAMLTSQSGTGASTKQLRLPYGAESNTQESQI